MAHKYERDDKNTELFYGSLYTYTLIWEDKISFKIKSVAYSSQTNKLLNL